MITGKTMTYQFAFVGFRHPHIMDMYRRCLVHDEIEVSAGCEPDGATAAALTEGGEVEITHRDVDQLLEEVPCDVVAIGDCYGLRAERILAALRANKHVICDKPLSISLADLEQIRAVASERGRKVGCMLDMRDHPVFLGIRAALREGEVGEVHAINFEGQHPLLYGRRPDWYFEPGMHGGVFNDIAVHALDILPWMTGLQLRAITAARGWNATLPQHPHFEQCGQLMLELENGAGVLGDISYLTPDSFAYAYPNYWRFTVWGSGGVLEGRLNANSLTIFRDGNAEAETIELPAGMPGAYLDSFLAEIEGRERGLHLHTEEVYRASRAALLLQQVADSAEPAKDLGDLTDHASP